MALRPLTLPTLELRPAKKITDVMITGENMAIEGIEAKIDAILTNRGFGNQTVDIISEDKVNKPPQQYRIRLGTTEGNCILIIPPASNAIGLVHLFSSFSEKAFTLFMHVFCRDGLHPRW